MKLDLSHAETLCVCVCVCMITFNNKYIFFLVQKDMAISPKVHYKTKSLTV